MSALDELIEATTETYVEDPLRSTAKAAMRELAALREALAMSQSGVSALAATIGHPPSGSHPDEAHPRAATWLAERANWEKEVAALRERVAKLEAVRVWHKRTGCFARLDPRQHFTNEGDCYEPKSATMEAGESLVMRLPGEHPSDMECDLCSILDCPANCEDHYHHDGCPSCDVAREATK